MHNIVSVITKIESTRNEEQKKEQKSNVFFFNHQFGLVLFLIECIETIACAAITCAELI